LQGTGSERRAGQFPAWIRKERIVPHVTFVHGIANKPAKEVLLRDWEDALALGGLDLAASGVTTSMVYWADVLYAEPEESARAYESVDQGLGTEELDEDLAWVGELPEEQAAMVAGLRSRLRLDQPPPEGKTDAYEPPPPEDENEALVAGAEAMAFEAVPLPWFIKRRLMKALLRDVHHYLFKAKSSPRPGVEFDVQKELRRRFIDQLKEDAAGCAGNHVVLSHSMGTVISYDCIKNVDGCPPVAGLMTVGSPLGLSEVHDNFDPRYRRDEAFPADGVAGEWVNVYDRLDPVAFDARLGNDYKKAGQVVVTDERVHNSGRWRHSSWKYFGQSALVGHLQRLLGLGTS
jgi:hypothetical protein